MGTVDLDAARAARAETQSSGHVVRFGGQDFHLPVEVPFEVAETWSANRTKEGLGLLLGDQAEAFWKLQPSIEDVTEMLRGVAVLYGFSEVGESSASNGSSPSTSSRSRPTSPASTG